MFAWLCDKSITAAGLCQTRGRERGGGGDPGLKPTLRVLLPLARSYHLTFPQHSRTATPAGVQTSKRQSNCAISCSIIYWILGPLSLTTHSVVLRPVVLATLRTSRIFYTQGWHESLHLKQNPKWIICTSSLTSTAVVVQIRAVPTSSGIWILGPLLMVPFGEVMEFLGVVSLLSKGGHWGQAFKLHSLTILPVHSHCFLEVKVWSLNFILLTFYYDSSTIWNHKET